MGSREHVNYKLHKMLYCQVCVCMCQRVVMNYWHQNQQCELGWHHQEWAKWSQNTLGRRHWKNEAFLLCALILGYPYRKLYDYIHLQ